MKRILLVYLLLLLFVTRVDASHIFGGELLYTHISDSTYKLTLTVYGDCGGNASAFSALYSATPMISIYQGTAFYDTTLLAIDSAGVEVSPVCKSQINNTTCHGGTLPGVKKFVYSGNIKISRNTDWRFVFDGNFENSSVAGRSGSITNINNPGMTVMYIVATLNNEYGINNNPQYTTVPTPFYCLNVTQRYNQGASDADGDSLSFELTPALAGGATVTYLSGYSYLLPISADTFSFDPLNGQMDFKPNAVQDALVVTKVSEYRNGVLVGTSMREMTFIVSSSCDNDPPGGTLANLSGGVSSGNTITVCQGTPNVSFNVNAADLNGDSIMVTASGVPSTASYSVANNNSTHPVVHFSWNTSSLSPGVYTFFISYKDNHCPISSTQTIAYTVIVISRFAISVKQLAPTQCLHQAYMEYDLTNGTLPRKLVITQGATVIKTYTDSTGVVRDSLPAGNYTATVSAINTACPVSLNFSIADSGILPNPYTQPFSYCKGDTIPKLTSLFADGGTTQWYKTDHTPLPAPPAPSTNTPGTYVWLVTEQYKVCRSDTDTVTVVVHDLPKINILNKPESICIGDKIYLEATGGIKYAWATTSGNELSSDKDGTYTILIDTATYWVTVTDENNCKDSASVTYNDIQPCCQFSYPSAFTPNSDGRNDLYHVITYGNMKDFELSIFDRWGELVFHTRDPKEGWNGNYHGQPCEIGSYFYLVRAKCIAGHFEQHAGDITLIR